MHHVNTDEVLAERQELENFIILFYDTYSYTYHNSNPEVLDKLISKLRVLRAPIRRYKLSKVDKDNYPRWWCLKYKKREDFLAAIKSASMEALRDTKEKIEKAGLDRNPAFQNCKNACENCRDVIREARARGGKPLSRDQKNRVRPIKHANG